ncbi:hypothetical protein SAMN05216266_11870 [Amycolatopsis marina]|uniref:Uncharacterized protein n=1 Tax=Amycolatopsis marina TaxID=490629 RepID=A0A1I1BWD0_9PSEU|nr:hypothetical protein [Amycolatopsis marina]SFB54724.1 hypothetical protein SAMN05216266_11870 [Amycolatopsis marina]
MGFFGAYVFDKAGWRPHRPGQKPDVAGPWLTVDIYDSDFTTVTYSPTGPGSGVAYLGFTPRDYFEEEDASQPTDVAREAAGLAFWWTQVKGDTSESERAEKERLFATYLADDEEVDPAVLTDDAIGQFEDDEIFVEVRTARFLDALNLPVPEDLPH